MTEFTDVYKATLASFSKRVEALGSIKDRDRMAAEVLEIVNELYQRHANPDPAFLQRAAVKLTGAYSYLALKAAKLEAEADMAEIAADGARNALVTAYSNDPAINVTQARGMADKDVMEDRADARVKELVADEYAIIAKVAEKTISLIQSVLRQQQTEANTGRKWNA